jgi:hypothetical protein
MFRSVMMTVQTGHVVADYISPVGFVNLDSFDLTRSVDAAVFCYFDDNSTPSVELRSLVEAPVPMNGTTGIPIEMIPMGRFIEVNLTGNISLNRTILRLYYTKADLDINGDGDADDESDLDESTLRLFRIENGTWIDISPMITINTTDHEVNGIPYAGYVSANLDHFSVFGLAGKGFEIGTYELDIGPILDENGLIVENASVTISLDGFMNSSLTDSEGNTVFTISRAISEMPVTISISKEGYHDLNHTTNITSGGVLEEQPPRLKIVREVIENKTKYFFLEIGPVLNSTGDPVESCSIHIEIGNMSMDGSTDALGEASFNLSEDLLGSDIHIILSKEGYENLYHNTSISMEGTLETNLPEMVMKETYQPVEKPDDKEEKEDTDIDWIIVLVLIVLLVIVAAIVIISRRNRSDIDEE